MKRLGLLIGSLFVAGLAFAEPHGTFYGKLWNFPLAVSTDAVRDLNLSGEIVSAQVDTSSLTIAAQTFTDGTVSTGSITVSSNPTGGFPSYNVAINNLYVSFTYDVNYASNTAYNMCSAILANPYTSLITTCTASGSVVYTTSTAVGAGTNYTLATSSPAAFVVSGPTMTGGTSATYSLSTGIMGTGASSFPTGLPVLYTSGTITVNPLVNQTTYYAIPATAGGFQLASTSTGAVAGSFITLTSSTTGTTAHTFTITPLAISGTSTFTWQQSDDNVNWTSLLISTQTFAGTTAQSTQWTFGTLFHRYLRLDITALTAGAEQIAVWFNQGTIYAGN